MNPTIQTALRNGWIKFPEPAKPKPKVKPIADLRGCVPINEWLNAEADRLGMNVHAVWTRFARGKYPNVKRVFGPYAKGKRASFVEVK